MFVHACLKVPDYPAPVIGDKIEKIVLQMLIEIK
jgi:hypothetical protein